MQKVSDPVLLSADDAKNGMNAYTPSAANAYAETVAAGAKVHVCCPNEGAVVVYSPASLSADTTVAEALASDASAAIIPENGSITISATKTFYLKAYHPDNLTASDMITCVITV